MENVAHWTQQSIADFVYAISSTFVAQIETKMEDEEVSRSEIARKMNRSGGRITQILGNPGNLTLRVMAETARSLGMKVGVIAYDDSDPTNNNGPIDPDVFVKCWKYAGRPSNLFEADAACAPLQGSPEFPVVDVDIPIGVIGSTIVWAKNPQDDWKQISLESLILGGSPVKKQPLTTPMETLGWQPKPHQETQYEHEHA